MLQHPKGMVQCCKVGVEARVPGAAEVVGERMGDRKGEGAGGSGSSQGGWEVESDRRTCVDSQLCCPVPTSLTPVPPRSLDTKAQRRQVLSTVTRLSRGRAGI